MSPKRRSRGRPDSIEAARRARAATRDPWQDAVPPGAGPSAGAAGPDALTEGPAARLAAELAGLPPAERYERLIDFPTEHPFKVIGAADQSFTDLLRAALAGLGYPDVTLRPRYSSGVNYVAYTVTLRVADGAAMVKIYEALGALPGLRYLL
ncbi:MAG: DUF493 domain-containing protein [Deltaproteobacteria bacterium]|nr:DUF493 domain-containing protein [Deltaproteobacteria bacterium]